MRIVQAIHIGGTDNHKRYWKVPERLEQLRIKEGDEAIIQRDSTYSRIKITKVITSESDTIRWKGGSIKVTEEILTTVKQEIDRKYKKRSNQT
ncbi:hypothetical protein [Lactococcus lactis]|uniref:hypothetical protein n=1 Tax=Lactococcus lactis TaxID=1358 RepID=UPI00289008B7|nr:hypothetical protein [Lactococcus lactis]MDT2909334.1 hypothetical protein [Lactococcus lactis]MDT2925136.1 hypothetical protein [Lactococcus lactis]MDT2951995.1 hypothetical protein [Lactococcus lactis]